MGKRSWGAFRRGPRAGFTTVEVLAVLALVAAAAACALPSFGPMVDRWRVRRAVAQLQSVMRFANAQAVRTRSRVVIAARPASCRSLTSTQNWSCGVTVFQDINGNNAQDAGEPTLRNAPEFDRLAVMHAGGSNAYLAYGPRGFPIGNPSRFEFYPAADPDSPAARTICLSAGGRMRVTEGIKC